MLYRSISVAMILLLSWFAFTSMQSMQRLSLQLSLLNQTATENAKLSLANRQALNDKIDQVQEFIVSQKQLAIQKKQIETKLASQKQFSRFQTTYSKVLLAEILRSNNRLKDAAKLLKSTKKDIWTMGDTYKDKQKSLRSLMPKIDASVNAWNKGDGKMSAKSVYSILDKIIQDKGQ